MITKEIEIFRYILGLTGFDSGMEWYVSMQCVGDWHYNLSY